MYVCIYNCICMWKRHVWYTCDFWVEEEEEEDWMNFQRKRERERTELWIGFRDGGGCTCRRIQTKVPWEIDRQRMFFFFFFWFFLRKKFFLRKCKKYVTETNFDFDFDYYLLCVWWANEEGESSPLI